MMNTLQTLADVLPVVPPLDAGVSRLLCDRRWLQRLGGAIAFGRSTVDALPDAAVYRVLAQCAAGPVEILLCAPTLGSLSLAASHDTPSALRPVLAEATLGPWVDAVHRCGIEDFGVVKVEAAALDAAARARTWQHLRVEGEVVAWFSCVRLPPAALDALSALSSRHAAALTGWPAALPLCGRVRLAQRTLPSSWLQQMEHGDVLILPLPARAWAEPLPVAVRWGAGDGIVASATALLKNKTLTFQGVIGMDTEVASEDDRSVPAPHGVQGEQHTLDELELPVRFELDTVAMPLGELRSVQKGYVIELPTPLREATVRLVACGQTVAHAELVAVGERLGARITRMLLQETQETQEAPQAQEAECAKPG
jgi:type III secretion protein Q